MTASAVAIEQEIKRLEGELEQAKKKNAPKTLAEQLEIAERERDQVEGVFNVAKQNIAAVDRALAAERENIRTASGRIDGLNAKTLAQSAISCLEGDRAKFELALRAAEEVLTEKDATF